MKIKPKERARCVGVAKRFNKGPSDRYGQGWKDACGAIIDRIRARRKV